MSRVLVTFSVDAKPVPKPGLIPNGHGGVRYPRPAADHYRAFKSQVARACEVQLPDNWTPYEGAVAVQIIASFKSVKARPHEVWHTKKPDIENCASKPMLDALTGLVWVDDSQVSVVNQAKVYAEDGPYVTMQIIALDDEDDVDVITALGCGAGSCSSSTEA